MNAWLNFIGYQLTWFAVIAAAAHGRGLAALACGLAFIAIQLFVSERRSLDFKLLTVAAAIGVALDGTLAALGWVAYAAPAPALPPHGAPLWILALWASFALTLPRSLKWLARFPGWAILFGALGGPLAYWSAARGFDAVRFVTPGYRAVVALAAGWAAAISLLFFLVRRWTRAAGGLNGTSRAACASTASAAAAAPPAVRGR